MLLIQLMERIMQWLTKFIRRTYRQRETEIV